MAFYRAYVLYVEWREDLTFDYVLTCGSFVCFILLALWHCTHELL